MGTIKNENFITIQGWMRTELDLKGNDLYVYAIIYGFSQIENQKFTGSLQYLADWCGATKQGILKNLNNLLDRGLIKKEEKYINNMKVVEYYSTEFNGGIKLSLTNNIEDNIDNSKISNNKLLDITIPEKPKKKNLYAKCSDYVMQYTNNAVLQDVLFKFLSLRLEIAKNEGKPFYYNMWPSIVNDLDKYDTDTAIEVVKQSITKGWKRFYDIKDYSNSKVKSDPTERNVMTNKKLDKELDIIDEEY